MNTPHTLAPWTARPTDLGDGALWITGEPDDQKAAQLIAVVATGNPQHEANARLIAAAPDMHQLLKDIDNENGRHFHLDPDLAKRLRALLDS